MASSTRGFDFGTSAVASRGFCYAVDFFGAALTLLFCLPTFRLIGACRLARTQPEPSPQIPLMNAGQAWWYDNLRFVHGGRSSL